ncbi:hypothetical protein FJZ17_00550 [Candidatus Pacearchaeota archaeon]|nr:hypothetical protein [Candidatus Pacearchaeota archaeon]
MTDYSRISAIDRSNFFRHKSDYSILRNYLEQTKGLTTALVIGIGNLEEPLSILATGAETAKTSRRSLGDLLKLDLVELRPFEEISPIYSLGEGYGPERNPLGGIFLTEEQKRTLPRHPLKPSFVNDYPTGFELKDGEYRFSQEVIEHVQEAIQRGKFSTRVQDFIRETTAQYPVIFFNHVITHLGSEGEKVAYDLTTRTLKDGGIIFMHSSGDIGDSRGVIGTTKIVKDNPRFAHLQRVGPAVYRRIR